MLAIDVREIIFERASTWKLRCPESVVALGPFHALARGVEWRGGADGLPAECWRKAVVYLAPVLAAARSNGHADKTVNAGLGRP